MSDERMSDERMSDERMSDEERVAELVRTVLGSRKYGGLQEEFVASVARRELATRRSARAALDGTRRRLHQVVGAYRGSSGYRDLGAELERAAGEGRLKDGCRSVMSQHASTRERLPILERLYGELLEPLAPIGSVLDLACGLHPLALPWLGLDPDTRYLACDVDLELIALLERFFVLADVRGRAFAHDLAHGCPDDPVDVALLLKALPCLERLERDAGAHLLDRLRARWLIVSFPVTSLGGRRKGMPQQYEAQLTALLRERALTAERIELPGELFFRIRLDRR